MSQEWSNWSGSLSFEPARIVEPDNEDELAALVRDTVERNGTIRVVGAGHSSSPLVRTDDTLVSLARFQGLIEHDAPSHTAVVGAGMLVKDVGVALHDVGLALHNTGDVDVQTLAGAISTGTHGTGVRLGNLSTMLLGGRLITGTGEIVDVDATDPVDGVRVALGTCGIFTQLRIQALPSYQLHRREWCTTTAACMANLDELIETNRNFDFYWYPRSDEIKLRTMNELDEIEVDYEFAAIVRDQIGWSHEILPRERVLKFDEVEYALPREAGPECFQQVRRRVRDRWRRDVAWRVLYRTIAADEGWLSPMYGRESVTISLHHNAGMPYDEYFADIEPIFRAFDGRPHWGKKHTLTGAEIAPMYPMWHHFQQLRALLDPHGVFMSADVHALLQEHLT
jgi:FAD/FMN-containing dehydrogenase